MKNEGDESCNNKFLSFENDVQLFPHFSNLSLAHFIVAYSIEAGTFFVSVVRPTEGARPIPRCTTIHRTFRAEVMFPEEESTTWGCHSLWIQRLLHEFI